LFRRSRRFKFCFTKKKLRTKKNKNIHDSKTLNIAISHANNNRNKPIKQAVVGRIRSLFDKFQIGCVQEVCVVTL
jgi:hypothetical protein